MPGASEVITNYESHQAAGGLKLTVLKIPGTMLGLTVMVFIPKSHTVVTLTSESHQAVIEY